MRSPQLPEVTYVVVTAGAYDLLVETVCRDNAELLSFLADKLRRIPGVVSTETFVYLKITKQIVPLEHPFTVTPRVRPPAIRATAPRSWDRRSWASRCSWSRGCVLHWSPLLAWLVAWTPVAFVAYGMDKRAATRGDWRIPELVLHGLALIGGVIGAWAGRLVFRHKTRKPVFLVVLVIASVLWGAIAIWAITGH